MREIIREDTLMRFCDQLNEYIAALGCSAQELCAAANISPASASPVTKRAMSSLNSSASPITAKNSRCRSGSGSIIAAVNVA